MILCDFTGKRSVPYAAYVPFSDVFVVRIAVGVAGPQVRNISCIVVVEHHIKQEGAGIHSRKNTTCRKPYELVAQKLVVLLNNPAGCRFKKRS